MKQPLQSVYDIRWKPRILIEASAGTGKTYTIAGLYVRLLVEKKLTADRILVMTFTRKATAELRERIFNRLRECQRVLENGVTAATDDFLATFIQQVPDRAEAVQIINDAIRNFDENQVTTIHGFCQKVLNEEALSAGTPFELDITQHDDALVQAVEDYWREFISRHSESSAGKYFSAGMISLAPTPEKLKSLISPLISKSYAEIRGEVMDDPLGYLERIIKAKKKLKGVWESDQESIRNELLAADLKNYTEKNVSSWMLKMDEFLNDSVFGSDTFTQIKYFSASYQNNPDNLKKNKHRVPDHPFFGMVDMYIAGIEDIDGIKTTLIFDAFKSISEKREKNLNNSSAICYDDLLKSVQRALDQEGSGKELAHSLLRKYPFALVDEFQDTDPVQYHIFDRIYPKEGGQSGLFMIGDPKQAIYAFRGADIYTYFKARKAVSEPVYTLEKNYRSTPRLIKAVNTIFGGERNAFIQPEIDYFDIADGLPELSGEFLVNGEPSDQFRITVKNGAETNKEPCFEFAFEQTVSEISGLLDLSRQGNVTIKGQKLRGGDIAILVSDHRHAAILKKKLKSHGIDSVTYSRQQVFDTFEAHRLGLLMAAVLEPLNQVARNNVLMSGLFGIDLSLLHQYSEDEAKNQQLVSELLKLNEIWHRHGFYPMLRSLLNRENRFSEIARLSGSERILVNMYQLGDICTKAEREGKLDPRSLYAWFMREKNDPGNDEERTLLLESDQNLVKISTIHNSKGLQYPVVFCPGLWEAKKSKSILTEYHPDGSETLVIHAGQQADEERKKAEQKSLEESVAEEIRKAYVAVTRAKYQCNVIWANHKDSRYSGFGAQAIGEKVFNESGNQIIFEEIFKCYEKSSPEAIRVDVQDEPVKRTALSGRSADEEPSVSLRRYSGRKEIAVCRKTESFSSLMQPHSKDDRQQDYDQVMESYISAFDGSDEETRKLNLFYFPKGAAAGTVIHKLFEREEFSFQSAGKEDDASWIDEVLKQYQIDQKWTPVMQQMLKDVAGASFPGFELSRIKKSDMLSEMEFHFLSSDTSSERLLQVIRKQSGIIPAAGRLNCSTIMTGFIDLIIRENGRYYILDYKSNHLGDELSDYGRQHLFQEILANGYDLQFHLYTVALVKYMRKKVKEFDYETHFGGVAYLFVRGMRAGSSNGIWFHKPDQTVIRELEKELTV